MNKIILDTSVLGLGYYHDEARTGIFRVVEELFKNLSVNKDIELSLANTEHLPEMLVYLKKYFPESQFNLLNKKTDKFRSNIENTIISMFPFKSKQQTLVRKVLVRSRGHIKSHFSFDTKIFSKYDIYHTPFLPIPNELRGLSKPKKIITIHDLIPHLFPEHFGPWNKMMMQKTFNCIDQNTYPVCISESTKNDLVEATGIATERVSVIHLAASKEVFYQENDKLKIDSILKKYNIPTDRKHFLSVSTLEPRKNIERTIRAFLNLIQQQQINDLNLVLVGAKGWQFDGIFKEIMSKPALKERIIVTGFVADEDLAALYSSAIGFVFPSFYEGFGLPPLEAMQCGTPIISSTKSSIPEVVGDAGILVEPNDETAISDAMLKFYQNENLRVELSKKALIQASKFSWEKFTDEHIKLYQRVASYS